jgi:hypothetical protein
MSKVQISPKEDGSVITPYSNAKDGYITVKSETRKFVGGWARMSKRTALIRGPLDMLEDIVKTGAHGLKGQIVVFEFIETNLPPQFEKQLDPGKSGKTREDLEKFYLKTAGKDGEPLTHNGERIFRFCEYDETGALNDIVVQHNNVVIGSSKIASTENVGADVPF